MALKAFKRIQFTDINVLQFQANVAGVVQQLSICPFLTGAYVKGQKLTTGATNVSHGLGALPQGFFVLTSNANATVWQTASSTTTLTLQASAAVTVDLWIF